MTTRPLIRALALAVFAALAVPALASADTLEAYNDGAIVSNTLINTLWVLIAAVLVLFMPVSYTHLTLPTTPYV